jgi:membrane associated rhomboid family serine protease
VQVLVGASGGIAGLTGAAVRFIFQPPIVAVHPETGERRLLGRRLASLREVLASPTPRFFTLVWIVLNGIVPLLPLLTGTQMSGIAWQAHLGGFLAGLLLVPLFERKPR